MPAPVLFQIPVRIYWEDTDASGVVYHANYARFFERARSDWLRQHGIDQSGLAESLGALIVVRRMAFELDRPARLDDLCWASVEILRTRKVSAVLRQELRQQHDASLLVSAEITLACLDAGTFRPAPFPAAIQTILAASASPQAVSP
ncbi:MAG: YbgC/FadM family acyl-CoA thioesterase [Xanthomonadaceae bacterium]|nr:YbgC/FadM family acyl-CoA thioesterase [Xanthomonadaceae bacterium]